MRSLSSKIQREIEIGDPMGSQLDLVDEALRGSVRAVAKLITLVENEMPGAIEVLKRLYPQTGHAYTIGITGPSGSGKSTLVDRLTKELRQGDYTVGIIAVDPSSPFSGGALLGDRLRMQEIANDAEVFVRSMATRGTLGGLSRAAADAVKILDAFGKDFILIETVGVGQDEVDIVKTADTTVLVSVPGLGDEIQALKAGIMEIGDIFVVNKADREGADRLAAELGLMLEMKGSPQGWSPPIVQTVATRGSGISELQTRIFEHRKFLMAEDRLEQKRIDRIREEVTNLIEREISGQVHKILKTDGNFEDSLRLIQTRRKDPYSYAQELTEPILKSFRSCAPDGESA
jgi:LAO/AO transport system kinase